MSIYHCPIRQYHRRPPTDTCFLKIETRDSQNLQGALRPMRSNCISAVVTINRLQTFANALFNASIADPPFSSKDLSFTFAGIRTLAYGRSFPASAGLLVKILSRCFIFTQQNGRGKNC